MVRVQTTPGVHSNHEAEIDILASTALVLLFMLNTLYLEFVSTFSGGQALVTSAKINV